jgi:hypothetical protein
MTCVGSTSTGSSNAGSATNSCTPTPDGIRVATKKIYIEPGTSPRLAGPFAQASATTASTTCSTSPA